MSWFPKPCGICGAKMTLFDTGPERKYKLPDSHRDSNGHTHVHDRNRTIAKYACGRWYRSHFTQVWDMGLSACPYKRCTYGKDNSPPKCIDTTTEDRVDDSLCDLYRIVKWRKPVHLEGMVHLCTYIYNSYPGLLPDSTHNSTHEPYNCVFKLTTVQVHMANRVTHPSMTVFHITVSQNSSCHANCGDEIPTVLWTISLTESMDPSMMADHRRHVGPLFSGCSFIPLYTPGSSSKGKASRQSYIDKVENLIEVMRSPETVGISDQPFECAHVERRRKRKK